MCVCARARAFACVRACVRACVCVVVVVVFAVVFIDKCYELNESHFNGLNETRLTF